MALDRNVLEAALIAAFQQGLDDPAWTKEQAAGALADAIDAFLRSAEVTGVTTDVVDPGNAPIGTGTQNNIGVLT